MDESDIDENALEVYALYSHMFIPLNLAVHVWFVINDHGELTRWDGGKFVVDGELKLDVHKNVLEPFQGIRRFRSMERWRQGSHLIKKLTGEQAKKLAGFLTDHARDYPYKDFYRYLGPNSNTFAQWVIDESGVDVKLPWNAFGKGYA